MTVLVYLVRLNMTTGDEEEIVICLSGPVSDVVTFTVSVTAGSMSTMQVKLTSAPTGLIGLEILLLSVTVDGTIEYIEGNISGLLQNVTDVRFIT